MRDSVTKLVKGAMALVTRQDFTYNGRVYTPQRRLLVSTSVFSRGWCPASCAACCNTYSLDWLPDEAPPEAVPREIDFTVDGGPKPLVFSDLQRERSDRQACKHVQPDGFCGIHQHHPLSCDLPLLVFQMPQEDGGQAELLFKKFGRAHLMTRIDGGKGGDCRVEKDASGGPETARKLRRLKGWTDHFGIADTWLPEIIDWVEAGPHMKTLRLPTSVRGGTSKDATVSGLGRDSSERPALTALINPRTTALSCSPVLKPIEQRNLDELADALLANEAEFENGKISHILRQGRLLIAGRRRCEARDCPFEGRAPEIHSDVARLPPRV